MLRKLLKTSQRLAPMARARKERRQYTVEELSNNNWIFPDEDCSVMTPYSFKQFSFPIANYG